MFVLSLLSHDLVELLFFFVFYFSPLFYMCIGYDFRYKYPILEITTTKKKLHKLFSKYFIDIFQDYIFSSFEREKGG
jgi:hypothetical protein